MLSKLEIQIYYLVYQGHREGGFQGFWNKVSAVLTMQMTETFKAQNTLGWPYMYVVT